MRAALVVISWAACSSPGSAGAPPDAQVPGFDARTERGAVVHASMSGAMAGTSTLTIPPFADGDLLVAVLAFPEGGSISKNVMAGNTALNSWIWIQPGDTCKATAEIWISTFGPAAAGVSTLTVERDDGSPFTVAAFELSGVTFAGTTATHRISGMTPGSAPSLDTVPGELVFSTLTTCGTVTAIAPTSTFVALDTDDDGTSNAYYVPTVEGIYGAAWSYDGGPWDSSTIVFR